MEKKKETKKKGINRVYMVNKAILGFGLKVYKELFADK